MFFFSFTSAYSDIFSSKLWIFKCKFFSNKSFAILATSDVCNTSFCSWQFKLMICSFSLSKEMICSKKFLFKSLFFGPFLYVLRLGFQVVELFLFLRFWDFQLCSDPFPISLTLSTPFLWSFQSNNWSLFLIGPLFFQSFCIVFLLMLEKSFS